MVEAYLRRSPLAHLSLAARAAGDAGRAAAAGVRLSERPHRTLIDLRGDAGDLMFLSAVENACRVTLPVEPNTVAAAGDVAALWLGPDEWLLVGPGGRAAALVEELRRELMNQHASVIDVSESRTAIRVAGPGARDLLAKGTGLDLHPRALGPGRCAQTGFARASIILHRTDSDGDNSGPAFDLYILVSFADYLWHWLEKAAVDLDLAVVEGR